MNAASGIIVGYVLLAALLAFFCLSARQHWLIKAAMVGVVSAFYIFTAQSVKGLLGWPTGEELPDRFRLVSSQVYEPDKLTESEGVIYLWVTYMDDRVGLSRPRGFKLPYDADLHSRLVKAKSKMASGIPQMGQVANSEGRTNTQTTPGQTETAVDFYDIPIGALPDK